MMKYRVHFTIFGRSQPSGGVAKVAALVNAMQSAASRRRMKRSALISCANRLPDVIPWRDLEDHCFLCVLGFHRVHFRHLELYKKVVAHSLARNLVENFGAALSPLTIHGNIESAVFSVPRRSSLSMRVAGGNCETIEMISVE